MHEGKTQFLGPEDLHNRFDTRYMMSRRISSSSWIKLTSFYPFRTLETTSKMRIYVVNSHTWALNKQKLSFSDFKVFRVGRTLKTRCWGEPVAPTQSNIQLVIPLESEKKFERKSIASIIMIYDHYIRKNLVFYSSNLWLDSGN